MNFDSERPFWVRPEFVQANVQNAWIAQFAGDSWLSRILMYGTQGAHSHSAMCRRNYDKTVDLLELREFIGGRAKPLSSYTNVAGRIDFFSPCKDGIYADIFSPVGAVDAMHSLTAHDYGYRSVSRMALRRIPIVWRLYPVSTSDDLPEDNPDLWQPFCSHAVALAMQRGGGVDVVPRCPNFAVSPSDLTRSMFFEYEFSLWGPWAAKRYAAQIPDEIALRANELAYTQRAASTERKV